MNNHEPSRREITTAYEALETLTDTCIHGSEQAEELRELVLRVLPPRPNPTMAEITWDEDEHYLAEALHPVYGKVLMQNIGLTGDWIGFAYWNGEDVEYCVAGLEELEPTGRHYFRNDKD